MGVNWWSIGIWAAWLAVFGVLELLALYHTVPWQTHSDTTWSLENLAGWVPWVVLFALAALLVHLVARRY